MPGEEPAREVPSVVCPGGGVGGRLVARGLSWGAGGVGVSRAPSSGQTLGEEEAPAIEEPQTP